MQVYEVVDVNGQRYRWHSAPFKAGAGNVNQWDTAVTFLVCEEQVCVNVEHVVSIKPVAS